MSRRLVLIISLALGVVPVIGAGAVAQAGLAVGTPVTYVDAEGITRGTITIAEVADPFLEYDPGRPPQEGMRYVLLTVVFEAAIDQPYDVQPYQLILRDTEGRLWTQGSVPRPADTIVIPDFQGQLMAPGNQLSGMVGFEVGADAVLSDILYAPQSGRLITVAPAAVGGPPLGTPVPVSQENGSTADLTVTLVDPYMDHDPGYPPAEGERFVMATVTFGSTGDVVFEADPYDLILRTTDGYAVTRSQIYRTEEGAWPDLDHQRMASGDRASGLVGYSVPVDSPIASVEYQPDSSHLLVVADLEGASAPAGDTVTEDAAASPDTAGTGR